METTLREGMPRRRPDQVPGCWPTCNLTGPATLYPRGDPPPGEADPRRQAVWNRSVRVAALDGDSAGKAAERVDASNAAGLLFWQGQQDQHYNRLYLQRVMRMAKDGIPRCTPQRREASAAVCGLLSMPPMIRRASGAAMLPSQKWSARRSQPPQRHHGGMDIGGGGLPNSATSSREGRPAHGRPIQLPRCAGSPERRGRTSGADPAGAWLKEWRRLIPPPGVSWRKSAFDLARARRRNRLRPWRWLIEPMATFRIWLAIGRLSPAQRARWNRRAEAAAADPLLSALDPYQRRATACFEDRAMVTAGAGSGKTRTMVARAGYAARRLGTSPDRDHVARPARLGAPSHHLENECPVVEHLGVRRRAEPRESRVEQHGARILGSGAIVGGQSVCHVGGDAVPG